MRAPLIVVAGLIGACGVETAVAEPGDAAADTALDGGAPRDASTPADAGNAALDAACTPLVTITIEDTGAGGRLFTDRVPDGEAFVQETGRRVCKILYREASEVRAANKVHLILRNETTVAGWKSGDVGDITVMISTAHLTQVDASGGDVKREIEGVLTHEMTHMYQNDDKAPGEGTYPRLGNVIEGVADAVRIRAGLPPTGSFPSKTGEWDDEGYWKPAYFLLWVDGQHPDTLYRLNASMAIGDGQAWSPAALETITGKSVSALWSAYATATCCTKSSRSCCQ